MICRKECTHADTENQICCCKNWSAGFTRSAKDLRELLRFAEELDKSTKKLGQVGKPMRFSAKYPKLLGPGSVIKGWARVRFRSCTIESLPTNCTIAYYRVHNKDACSQVSNLIPPGVWSGYYTLLGQLHCLSVTRLRSDDHSTHTCIHMTKSSSSLTRSTPSRSPSLLVVLCAYLLCPQWR